MSDSRRLGQPRAKWLVRLGSVSVLIDRRALGVGSGLLVAALTVAAWTVLTGTYEISSAQAWRALWGAGEPLDRFIVAGQRLPRALAALLIGAMLALSGAVFQSLSRNPLGSPDIVGFTTGATTGGLMAIIFGLSSGFGLVSATTLGGFAVAALVVFLASRRGLGGEPLILVGIAVSEMLSATNDYLLSRATIESAEAAKAWQFGSLNVISWPTVVPLLSCAVILVVLCVFLARPAGIVEMGDDAAASLGVRVGRLRGVLLGYGVVLAAVCVAAAGPIGFLALAAPQLARRACRSSGIVLGTSAAMGAFVLVMADLLAQRLLAPFQIPVGLVSAALGGLYLMWLLGWRR